MKITFQLAINGCPKPPETSNNAGKVGPEGFFAERIGEEGEGADPPAVHMQNLATCEEMKREGKIVTLSRVTPGII